MSVTDELIVNAEAYTSSFDKGDLTPRRCVRP